MLRYNVFPKTTRGEVKDFSQCETIIENGNFEKILFQEEVQNFSSWWSTIMGNSSGDLDMQKPEASLLGLWCIENDNNCDITICSMGYCIKKVDEDVRSQNLTHKKHFKGKPASEGVKTASKIFTQYLEINCLTDEQKQIFNSNNKCNFC